MEHHGTPPRVTDWIGRTEEQSDCVSATTVAAAMATLLSRVTEPRAGEAAPELSHWLHFLPLCPLDQTGPDGHPAKGGFLPPITLPRRMWAGSQIRFMRPLRVGHVVQRHSKIIDVTEKEGRSGRLAFVKVEHVVSDPAGVLLIENQDIVYREAAKQLTPPPPNRVEGEPDWSRRIVPTPVLLFRFSALTFNSHRIHYDREYATKEEFYPGLVVHGPLLATLLLYELKERFPGVVIDGFDFKAVRPVIDTESFTVCGSLDYALGRARLYVVDGQQNLCMQAIATGSFGAA